MKILLGGALRAIVLIVLSVVAVKLAVWVIYGNDPSSDADIGIGLLPIVIGALGSALWAFVDSRRHLPQQVLRTWGTAAVVVGAAAFIRSFDSIGDGVLVGCFVAGIVVAGAFVGTRILPRGQRMY